jgi:hypothetical protein
MGSARKEFQYFHKCVYFRCVVAVFRANLQTPAFNASPPAPADAFASVWSHSPMEDISVL